jgi:HD-GYP domain-containing protein (c-di-GMP phosphodiesterase class II)
MQLAGPDKDLIISAARMHDTGKSRCLTRSSTRPDPTAEERALMQTHPERGAGVLHRCRDFERGIPIVFHHREAWDGSGYQLGLKGMEIPFGARLIVVADAFDAMTRDRPCRRIERDEVRPAEIGQGPHSNHRKETLTMLRPAAPFRNVETAGEMP